MIAIILLVFAFVLLALSAFWQPGPRVNLLAAGLAFWVLAELLRGAGMVH